MKDSLHFESILERLPGKGGLFYMSVPVEIAQQFMPDRKPVRMVCLLNNQVKFQCAIMPKSDGGYYINVGTPLRTEGKFTLGCKLSAEVWQDESQYGRDMPEELAELLAIDEIGDKLFHALLPGHQRGIIHYVASSKVVQTRIDRAIKMLDRLKIQH
ncbi:YdeI/OmpD-associated family protein [Dyadobacter sp. CY345]|uniref:YdeI/OmpD-associated family protein n=1 Tax=Dyadobacter sp. CY345 TaxID=2909335 RepID=UPI001F19C067|nr:YdeI/OmpD-associated family protein [Dyadobacter sp. CY345]MCF2447677.1 YdeI/OmpD-associated family protein [Dyadobacter sp. CY345]